MKKFIAISILALSVSAAYAQETERLSTFSKLLRDPVTNPWVSGMVAGVAIGSDKVCPATTSFATLSNQVADVIDASLREKPENDERLNVAQEGQLVKVALEAMYPCAVVPVPKPSKTL